MAFVCLNDTSTQLWSLSLSIHRRCFNSKTRSVAWHKESVVKRSCALRTTEGIDHQLVTAQRPLVEQSCVRRQLETGQTARPLKRHKASFKYSPPSRVSSGTSASTGTTSRDIEHTLGQHTARQRLEPLMSRAVVTLHNGQSD